MAERTQLSKQQKESILTQLLEGIAFLHEHGIIHRDLKPPNILIVNRNGEYIPKITDFGISKQLDINKSSVFNNSLAGAGTLSFASPEQLGDRTIRKNTDLWSFGVIAFWLLTGKLPFNAGSHAPTSETGRAELLRQITSGVLPSSLASLEIRWQKLIKSCLVVDAEGRIHKTNECLELFSGISSGAQRRPEPKPQRIDTPIATSQAETDVIEPATSAPPANKPTTGSRKFLFALLSAAAVVVVALLLVFAGRNNVNTVETDDDSTLYSDSVAIAEQMKLQADSIAHAKQLAQKQTAVKEEETAWNKAKSANTKAFYEQYLRDYPQGKYVSDARSKITEIKGNEAEINRQQTDQNAWNSAKNSNTKASYQKYLNDYPKGKFVSDARIKIKEINRTEFGDSQTDLNKNSESSNEAINQQKEEVFEGEIFTVVESMPEFPGGAEQMISFIARNIKYPPLAREKGIQGRVFVNFIIEPNGSVSNIKVLRGIGGGCDEEAIRVVESMPKWTPGRQRGKAVRVSFNLPVRFTLT